MDQSVYDETKAALNYKFVESVSVDNHQPRRQVFSEDIMHHYINCLSYFGTKKIAKFPIYSPAFDGISASLLSMLCYKVLGTSSVLGLENKQLNIYKLALTFRTMSECAQA